jgi:hypothetical protein
MNSSIIPRVVQSRISTRAPLSPWNRFQIKRFDVRLMHRVGDRASHDPIESYRPATQRAASPWQAPEAPMNGPEPPRSDALAFDMQANPSSRIRRASQRERSAATPPAGGR